MRSWIFVHIPKTGGTSVVASLPPRLCAYKPTDRHASAAEIRRAVPDLWREALTVSVVRNPWDRAVSAWAYQKEHIGAQRFEGWLLGNRPLRSQWDMLSEGGALLVKHVIRFENLKDGFDLAVRSLGEEPRRLAHFNASPPHRGAYRDHYTSLRLIELVREQYAEDIQAFEYRF